MLLDIHSHRLAPYPQGIISVNLAELPDFYPSENQLWSVGIHPWNADCDSALIERLVAIATLPQVIAIGECGIDINRGPLLFQQMLILRRQAEVAKNIGKPLILHCVKGQQQIISFHKEINPREQWIIHGFRGKPSIAQMLQREKIALSFGEKFNPESLKISLPELTYAETDESLESIQTILSSLDLVVPEVSIQIAENMKRLFGYKM